MGQITKNKKNRINCKTKAEYFQKLNVKDLPDNEIWKTTEPYFSNMGLNYYWGKRVS